MDQQNTPAIAAVCGERAASCVCRSPRDHTEREHRCGDIGAGGAHCGGVWTGTYNAGDFYVVAWPGAKPA